MSPKVYRSDISGQERWVVDIDEERFQFRTEAEANLFADEWCVKLARLTVALLRLEI